MLIVGLPFAKGQNYQNAQIFQFFRVAHAWTVTKPKKRLVFDYSNINSFLIDQLEVLPNAKQIINKISNFNVYAKIDIRSAFHNLYLKENIRKLTAFYSSIGVFEWKVLPFGIKTATAMFQSKLMEHFNEEYIVLFVDDLLIGGYDELDLANKLAKVLKKLEELHLIINIEKSEFFITKFEYLGLTFENGAYYPSVDKTEKLKKMNMPTSEKELKSFLGFTNYFAKFILHYNRIVQPLQYMLRKNVEFNIDDLFCKAFNEIKEIIVNRSSTLYIPNFDDKFDLYTDASLDGISGILVQNGYIVQLFSKELIPAERNYSINKLELLALYKSLKQFRYYIFSSNLTAHTDHEALIKQIEDKKDLSNKTEARWINYIRELNINIEFIKGEYNYSDYFSRYCMLAIDSSKFSTQELIAEQEKQFEKIIDQLVEHDLDHPIYKKYSYSNEVLYINDNFQDRKRIMLPKKFIRDVLLEYHDNNNHIGFYKTYKQILLLLQYERYN